MNLTQMNDSCTKRWLNMKSPTILLVSFGVMLQASGRQPVVPEPLVVCEVWQIAALGL